MLKMISGGIPITSGRLQVFGQDVQASREMVSLMLGVVPQEEGLDTRLNVMDNLLAYASRLGIPRRMAWERAMGLLHFFHLGEMAKTAVWELSLGMRRLLEIARAMVAAPPVMVLDEPTTGLEPQVQRIVWEKLRELKRYGLTLILATSFTEEAAQLCDRVGIMGQGHLLAEGRPEDLVLRFAGKEVLELNLPEEKQDDLLQALSQKGVTMDPLKVKKRLFLYGEDAEALWDEVREVAKKDDYGLESGLFRRCTLDDVYRRLTGQELREETQQ